MTINDIELHEGQKLPKWYYGFSYRSYDNFKQYWHPIPINYLVRLKRYIEHYWDKFRGRQTSWDYDIMGAYQIGYEHGRSDRAKEILLENIKQELNELNSLKKG